MAAGLDSISSVELRNAINAQFRIELPATATFDYPTVDGLAQFVVAASGQQGAAAVGVGLQLPAVEVAAVTRVSCAVGSW